MLIGFDGQTISYDGIGNPIVYRDGMVFSWTARQLDTVTINNTTNISYNYDINGIRIKKNVDNVTTEYFVDGSTIVAEKTGDNVIWYMYDVDGRILGFTYNDTPYYYVKNVQGDVVKVVDANGDVVASYTYDPWGKLLSATGSMAEINHIRYRGYYYDNETGLYYLNSRYYDSETCRFINADGYLTTGQGLLSYNMFAYCLNNPINYADPSGCIVVKIGDVEVDLFKLTVEGQAKMANAMQPPSIDVTTLVPPPMADMIIPEDNGVGVKLETDDKSGEKSVVVTNSYKVKNNYQKMALSMTVIAMAKENCVDMGFVTDTNGMIARWDSYNTLYDMGVYKSVTGNITFGRDDLMAHNYFVEMGKNNGYSYIPDFLLLDSVECVGVKSYAQQQNYTCGSASARMVLEYLGVKKDGKYISEMDIWNFANLCKHNYVCTCNCDCIWDCGCNCNWKCDCNCECYESLSTLDDYSDKGVYAAGTGYEQITRALNVFIDKSAKSNHEYAHFSDQVFGRYYAPEKTNSTLDYRIYAGFLIGSLKKGCPVIIKIYIPYDDTFFNYGFNSYHYVVVTGLQKTSNDDYMVTIHDPWAPGLDEGVVRTLRMSELRKYNDGEALGIMIYGRR